MNATSATSWAANAQQVGVVGAGTMGEGIAQSFAEAGLHVRLIDVSVAALERCTRQIGQNLSLALQYGLPGEDVARVLSRIESIACSEPSKELSAADMVIETVPEILELKRNLFAQLDALPADVLLGSNTSSMTMTSVCAEMNTPERVVGLHYFNPAHLIPTVEIHRGERTSEQSVERARAILLRSGKVPMLIRKEIPGFVINRLTGALMREIYHLLELGVVSPEELDAGVRSSLGFRMSQIGPLESADFTGLDVGVRVVSALLPLLSNRTEPPQALLDRVARGDLGIKTGRGWLDHQNRARDDLLNERNIKLLTQLKATRLGPGKS
jgi:3-hydroxybutyryl-CoA dehydrogenase